MRSLVALPCLTVLSLSAVAFAQAPNPAPTPTPTLAPAPVAWRPTAIDAPELPNAQWVTSKVISGGSPIGDHGFAKLRELGVKTIISVDGAKPDLAAARRHDLRYVHLPHGYDGVPAARVGQLAKAVRDLPGAIYVHCHHGKHRSPAAAAVACVGDGSLPPDHALAVLRSAGTSAGYRGLFASAQQAARLADELLDQLPAEFPDTVDPPRMVEAMTQLEHAVDKLKQIQQAGWQSPADHPDLSPPHEALLLREHYTELLRTRDAQARPAAFQQLLTDGEAAARTLEAALRSTPAAERTASADRALAAVNDNCKSCHVQFRDPPLPQLR